MNLWDIIPDEDQYLLNQIIFSEGYKGLNHNFYNHDIMSYKLIKI